MSALLPSERMPLPATLPRGERTWQGLLEAVLFALGFFAVFSPAGTSVAMGGLLLLALARPVRTWQTRPWREPLLAIGLVLLAYIALRSLVAGGLSLHGLHAANKYQELLLLPLIWALLRLARRPFFLGQGLVAGALSLASLYWIGLAIGADRFPGFAAWLVAHRISAGFALSVCAFLLLEHARLGKLPRKLAWAGALLLAATVLVPMNGRTGHLLLLLLLLCFAFRAAPRRARLPAMVGVLVVAVLAGALVPSVRERVLETFHDTRSAGHARAGQDSSTTIRLEILENATQVAREHWGVGTGWDQYPQAFAEVSSRRHADPKQVKGALSDNPHNEYLMQLGAGGLPALLLFVAWLAWPVIRGLRAAGRGQPWTGTLACVAVAFAVGSLFNSLLLDFIEAHFYAALTAWLLVRRVED